MRGVGMVAAPLEPGTFNPRRSMDSPGAGSGSGRGESGRGLPPDKGSGERKRRRKRRFPIWARVLAGFLLFLIILVLVGFGYYQFNFASAVNSITNQQVHRAAGEEDPNANRSGDILSGPRINILLLGSDNDQKFTNGNYIAQTDIVVTIDPASQSVGMLSIPRDFYINVPGYGMHKLDEAFGLGGVDLSRQTIQEDFGIPINYYAWVGLDGFIKVIDEVGGVDVDVIHPVVDDNYPDDTGTHANDPYAVKRLYLSPGPQHLDGATALEYVRSRHADLVGDFGRSARQQQVLSALKPKLENSSIFGKLSSIANDLKGYLKTDMQLPDVLKLMNFARGVDLNKIDRVVLGPPFSSSGTLPNGESVVYPNCAQIVPKIAQMLQLGDKAACNVQANSGNTPPVALTPGTNETNQSWSPDGSSSISSVQGLNNAVSNTAASIASGSSGLFGVQSLLDLMFLGVLGSPEAFQF